MGRCGVGISVDLCSVVNTCSSDFVGDEEEDIAGCVPQVGLTGIGVSILSAPPSKEVT